MTLRASLHWLITDWSFLRVAPRAEFLSRLSWPLHHDKTHGGKKGKKKKSSKQQTPTSTIRCCQPTRFSTCACVKASRHQPTHSYVAADKHTHTHSHASVHRPRPSLPNPSPISQYTASVRLQFVCGIVGGVGVVRWV